MFKVEYKVKDGVWQDKQEILNTKGEDFFNEQLKNQTFQYKSESLDKLLKFIEAIPKKNFEKGFPWRNEIEIEGKIHKVFTSKKKTRFGMEFFMTFENLKSVWGGADSKTHPFMVKSVLYDRIRRKYEYDNPYLHIVNDEEELPQEKQLEEE